MGLGPPSVFGHDQGQLEKALQAGSWILDIPVGEGRVVAFNFDPIHRTLTRSDFRMVWNAILNWNDFPEPPATHEEGAP